MVSRPEPDGRLIAGFAIDGIHNKSTGDVFMLRHTEELNQMRLYESLWGVEDSHLF